jgi:hypothetical protein
MSDIDNSDSRGEKAGEQPQQKIITYLPKQRRESGTRKLKTVTRVVKPSLRQQQLVTMRTGKQYGSGSDTEQATSFANQTKIQSGSGEIKRISEQKSKVNKSTVVLALGEQLKHIQKELDRLAKREVGAVSGAAFMDNDGNVRDVFYSEDEGENRKLTTAELTEHRRWESKCETIKRVFLDTHFEDFVKFIKSGSFAFTEEDAIRYYQENSVFRTMFNEKRDRSRGMRNSIGATTSDGESSSFGSVIPAVSYVDDATSSTSGVTDSLDHIFSGAREKGETKKTEALPTSSIPLAKYEEQFNRLYEAKYGPDGRAKDGDTSPSDPPLSGTTVKRPVLTPDMNFEKYIKSINDSLTAQARSMSVPTIQTIFSNILKQLSKMTTEISDLNSQKGVTDEQLGFCLIKHMRFLDDMVGTSMQSCKTLFMDLLRVDYKMNNSLFDNDPQKELEKLSQLEDRQQMLKALILSLKPEESHMIKIRKDKASVTATQATIDDNRAAYEAAKDSMKGLSEAEVGILFNNFQNSLDEKIERAKADAIAQIDDEIIYKTDKTNELTLEEMQLSSQIRRATQNKDHSASHQTIFANMKLLYTSFMSQVVRPAMHGSNLANNSLKIKIGKDAVNTLQPDISKRTIVYTSEGTETNLSCILYNLEKFYLEGSERGFIKWMYQVLTTKAVKDPSNLSVHPNTHMFRQLSTLQALFVDQRLEEFLTLQNLLCTTAIMGGDESRKEKIQEVYDAYHKGLTKHLQSGGTTSAYESEHGTAFQALVTENERLNEALSNKVSTDGRTDYKSGGKGQQKAMMASENDSQIEALQKEISELRATSSAYASFEKGKPTGKSSTPKTQASLIPKPSISSLQQGATFQVNNKPMKFYLFDPQRLLYASTKYGPTDGVTGHVNLRDATEVGNALYTCTFYSPHAASNGEGSWWAQPFASEASQVTDLGVFKQQRYLSKYIGKNATCTTCGNYGHFSDRCLRR